MSRNVARRHKWAIDFSGRNIRNDRVVSIPANICVPTGYVDASYAVEQSNRDTDDDLITKRSWDIALGPIKQVPMNFLIMWMAGNTISIFPIMMIGMMFFRPIQAFLQIQTTFKMIEGNQHIIQKFVYFLGNLISLGLAVYKCQVMGLLPTHSSDWLAFVEPLHRLEWSGGGAML